MSMKTRKLEPPMSIREVAELTGWKYAKVQRYLVDKHEASGRTLMEQRGSGVGLRYRITRAALRRACPDWFISTATLVDQINEIRERIEMLEKTGQMNAGAIGQLRRDLNKLYTRATSGT